jgi:transposase-like protein
MGTSSPAQVEAVSFHKVLPTPKRLHRSPELKRQIVQETLAPGASVARVARAHGVNANLVFTWRRQYRQELFEAGNRAAVGLLAVRVAEPAPHPKDVQTHRTLAAQEEELHSKDEQLASRQAESERLKLLIAKLRRMQFGQRSEKLERQIEQLELQLENWERRKQKKRWLRQHQGLHLAQIAVGRCADRCQPICRARCGRSSRRKQPVQTVAAS